MPVVSLLTDAFPGAKANAVKYHLQKVGPPHLNPKQTREDATREIIEGGLKDAPYFEIVGSPSDEELRYSTDEDTGEVSARRFAQVKTVIEPSASGVIVLLVNYAFLDVSPGQRNVALSRIIFARRSGGKWTTQNLLLAEDNCFLQSAEFVELWGTGPPLLLVRYQEILRLFAPSSIQAYLRVFDCRSMPCAKLAEVQTLNDSRDSALPEVSKQEKQLDLAKTRAAAGRALYFKVTDYTRDNKLLAKPETRFEVIPLRPATH
jgi:hypothetical protein